mgnify:CR=1 FL=1
MDYNKRWCKEVREFCIRDLAGILYRHVEHQINPRDLIDWHTAQDFIDSTLTLNGLQKLTGDFLELYAYSQIQKSNSSLPAIKRSDGSCWATDARAFILSDNDEIELKRINQELYKISSDEYIRLTSDEGEERETYKKLFLGRFVWDRFYHLLQKSLLLPQRGYGQVLFY